jgi:hypothetical protein
MAQVWLLEMQQTRWQTVAVVAAVLEAATAVKAPAATLVVLLAQLALDQAFLKIQTALFRLPQTIPITKAALRLGGLLLNKAQADTLYWYLM